MFEMLTYQLWVKLHFQKKWQKNQKKQFISHLQTGKIQSKYDVDSSKASDLNVEVQSKYTLNMPDEKKKLSIGAIIGLVVGCVDAVAIIVVVVVIVLKRKKVGQNSSNQ